MRRLLITTTTGAALALALISIIGFAAAFHWSFDIFNHFRAQYLCASAAGLFIAALQCLKFPVVVFSGTLLLNGTLIAPLYLPRMERPERLREVSAISYNAWLHNEDWGAIRDVLRNTPDLVFFTEANARIRLAIRESETDYDLFEAEENLVLVRRGAGFRARRMDAASIGSENTVAVGLSIEGVEVIFLGVHPPAPLNAGMAVARDRSFASMASWVAQQQGLVILVGDFNATPWSRAFRGLVDHAGLINSQRGFGIQPTWPSYPQSRFNWLLRIPIDHCLHSPAIHTIHRSVGDPRRSNHNPLFIRLGIPTTGKMP